MKDKGANSSDDKTTPNTSRSNSPTTAPMDPLPSTCSQIIATNNNNMTEHDLISVPNADTLHFFEVCNLGKVAIAQGKATLKDTIPIILDGSRLLNLLDLF